MKNSLIFAFMGFCAAVLVGCSSVPVSSERQARYLIGSAQTKNIFVDSSQFANRTVKLRLRSSSGDPDLNLSLVRSEIERGLAAAGYKISEDNFGILIDINAYMLQSVSVARRTGSNEVGALLGGVVGTEMARKPGGVSPLSGFILGAVTGATLQEVIRSSSESMSYLVACDVNIGVRKVEHKSRDSFIIGGSRVETQPRLQDVTFDDFSFSDNLKIVVYAGDPQDNRVQTIRLIQERLGRVIGNLL